MSRYLFFLFLSIICVQPTMLSNGQHSSGNGLSAEEARIAFITSDGQLATINADGSDLQVLSEAPARYQFPTWSPDGEHIAAVGNEGSAGIIDIFEDTAEESVRAFSSAQEPPFYMYWSPDAKTISFLANHPEEGMAMNFVDVDSLESRARAYGSPFYWHWSADSSSLLIHQGLLGGRLGFIDAAGDDDLEENLDEAGFFRSPGISPSGDYVAYGVSGVRGTEIVLENSPLSTSSDVPEVARALAHDGFTAMSWSPTEDQLAFILPKQATMNSFGALAMMDAETGLLETLTDESIIAFFWSPDGKYVMYLTPQRAGGNEFAGNFDNYRVATTDKQFSQSYLAQSDDIELAVTIVEVSTLETNYLTSIRPTPLFINQFIPFFEQYALSHNVWSGDSQAITLPTRDREGRSNIAIIYIEDGSMEVIAAGSAPFWQH